jgi:predicted esterase
MKNIIRSLVVTICFQVSSLSGQQVSELNEIFETFWQAETKAQYEDSVAAILASGIGFEEAYQRLQSGRNYTEAETGILLRSYISPAGVEYFYHLNVPKDYDPAREYQVRFELHGGIGARRNNEPDARGSGRTRLEGAEQIYVMPYAWTESPWWDNSQVENIRQILDRIKREYNVDENRVVLGGISDGATGTWYIAMRESTRFAAFYSFIGYAMVLANSSINDNRSYLQNLIGKPWYTVNSGRDRLYPTSRVTPFITFLQTAGVSIDYHPISNGEHNTRWWPDWRDDFEEFVTEHPRDAHPALISWKAVPEINHRSHWLQIETMDLNQHSPIPLYEVGVDARTGNQIIPMQKAARVDIVREGNNFQALSEHVSSFRLLLSPDVIDFALPITVTVNNELKFSGTLEPSLTTLLNWAREDKDRKMLYAAELLISL